MIEITSLCKTFSCLPDPGGLLQQDPQLLEGMALVVMAANERDELDAKKNK